MSPESELNARVTEEQREQLTAALTEELMSLRTRIGVLRGEVASPGGEFSGEHDLALGDRDELANLISRLELNVGEVERSIERLAGDEAGMCEVCGRPIPFARLEFLPRTTRCLDCVELPGPDSAGSTPGVAG